jgi:hypothetical protein
MSCQSRCHSESEQFWALPALQECPADESGEVSQEHRHAVRAADQEPASNLCKTWLSKHYWSFMGKNLLLGLGEPSLCP